MPKKCVKPARGVRSLPQVGSCDGGHKDSQSSSSSSSVSTRSSLSTIKQFKKAQLAEKKAVKKASRLGGEPTKQVPPHLVSHMLPYFYPNDCEDDPVENDGGTEVPPHLVSHVTPYCYPVHGTADSEDGPSPEPEVPRHLTPHVTTYCYPVTGTADDEDTHSPRPDVVPPHLESHITHYGQPTDNDGDLIEWPTDGRDEDGTRSMSGKRQLPTYNRRHLESHLFDSDNVHDNGRAELRTSICCEMTRDHANMRDSLFGEADTPAVRRIDRRRPVANCCNLFEESKPKPRPLSITIVARAQEDTKANIFGSESQKSCSRRRWENDTKKTIFGCEADAKTTPADSPSGAHGSRYEDTKEKLFGETYGIKEAQEEYDRRQRTVREDTKMTLFGPPVPSSPRPQSARSFMTTHNNLFGEPPPPQHGRRALLRENTFDNLFGMTQQRGITQGDTERYTTKNPKILKDSLTQVLSMDDPRHGPAPPQRRVRKAVYPIDAFRRNPDTVLSPITHEELSVITDSRATGPCDSHWTPAPTCCRRRNLCPWDTVNTITGETLPYAVSDDMSQLREAWVNGKIQNEVAPPPSARGTTV